MFPFDFCKQIQVVNTRKCVNVDFLLRVYDVGTVSGLETGDEPERSSWYLFIYQVRSTSVASQHD